MTKFIFLLLGSLPILSCKQSIPINQTELKQLFTQIIEDDSIAGAYYVVDSIDEIDKKEITEEGNIYKVSYCDVIRNNTWNAEIFPGAKVVSKAQMAIPYYSFSLPYLSENKQSLLIYYNLYCGNLCAESSLRLYKKVKGKWKRIKYYFQMVS